MIPQVQELIRTLEQLPEAEQARKAAAFMEMLRQETAELKPTLADLIAEAEHEIATGNSTPLLDGLQARRNKRKAS